MAEIIYGSEVSKKIKAELEITIESYCKQGNRLPCLAVILVGENPASVSYVKGKDKACHEIGMNTVIITMPDTVSEQRVIEEVQKCNQDKTIDGILVQLPLPSHMNTNHIIEAIAIDKDVDGLHPYNVGRFHLKQEGFIPCTPLGIMELLKEMKVDCRGKKATVIGRSNLVGNPIAQLLTNADATVTVCHSKSLNLPEQCLGSDIIIAAVGRALMVKKDWIKPGAVIIDVGVNRNESGKLVGDVDFEEVQKVAGFITPVPKGVGPMTITMLLKNTLKAYFSHMGVTHGL